MQLHVFNAKNHFIKNVVKQDNHSIRNINMNVKIALNVTFVIENQSNVQMDMYLWKIIFIVTNVRFLVMVSIVLCVERLGTYKLNKLKQNGLCVYVMDGFINLVMIC